MLLAKSIEVFRRFQFFAVIGVFPAQGPKLQIFATFYLLAIAVLEKALFCSVLGA